MDNNARVKNEADIKKMKENLKYLDKKLIPGLKALREIGYIFKNKELHFESEDVDGSWSPWACYSYSSNKKRRLSIHYLFHGRPHFIFELSCEITPTLFFDTSISLFDYLKFKKTLPKELSSKNTNFYELFSTFEETFIHTLTHDDELREMVLGEVPWKHPMLKVPSLSRIKGFEDFTDSLLIPELKIFRDIGLLYEKKKLEIKKSHATEYKSYDYFYIYKHKKSGIVFEIYITPELFFIEESLYLNIYIEHPDKIMKWSSLYPFCIGDYLRYKKRPEWQDWLKLAGERRRKEGKIENHLKLFLDLIKTIFSKDQNLRDIIQGKKWEEIPDYLMLQYR